MRKKVTFAAIVISLSLMGTASAQAEVRFGKNVRIGGHDFSHQTFNAKRRAEIHLYNGKPVNEGCVWKKDGKGSKVKICHLQTRDHRSKN
jgi:hypothetical protein